MNAITYQELNKDDLRMDILDKFNRYQKVTRCWRKQNDRWVITGHPFIDDWNLKEKRDVVSEMVRCAGNGGTVYGAVADGTVIGFACISADFFGTKSKYADLLFLHVSAGHRRQGIGRQLFQLAAGSARRMGAEKLYISAHSAEESQAFYRGIGCVDAVEINQALAEKEPFDCQLEYII